MKNGEMLRSLELSYAAFSNIKNFWLKEIIHVEKKLMLYKSHMNAFLTYNFGTWGMTMKKFTKTVADSN